MLLFVYNRPSRGGGHRAIKILALWREKCRHLSVFFLFPTEVFIKSGPMRDDDERIHNYYLRTSIELRCTAKRREYKSAMCNFHPLIKNRRAPGQKKGQKVKNLHKNACTLLTLLQIRFLYA